MYKAARVNGAQVQKQASWKNLKHFFLPFYIHHLKQIKVRKEKKIPGDRVNLAIKNLIWNSTLVNYTYI